MFVCLSVLSAMLIPLVGGLQRGDCVFVEKPEACAGGTFNVSKLTQDTPLRLDLWESGENIIVEDGTNMNLQTAKWTRVVDLENFTWTQCNMNSISNGTTLQEAPDDSCPKDGVEVVGWLLICVMVFLMALFAVKARESRKWFGVLYWFCDLMAGLYWGILVERNFPTALWYVQLLLTFAGETMMFDVPLTFYKHVTNCFQNHAFTLEKFIMATVVLGSIYGFGAITAAYTPSTIAFVGHHPLLLGLKSWLCDFPKAAVTSFLSRNLFSLGFMPDFLKSSSKGDYMPIITELEHPLPAKV